jgi:hypothetical protein
MGLKSNYEKLEKKYESENDCYTEAGRKKPTRLTEDKSEIQKQKQQLEQKKQLHYKDVIV